MMLGQRKANRKHLIQDSLPKKIYCDTNFFVSCILRDKERRHETCQTFLTRLAENGVVIFFNTIVYYEGYIAFIKNILKRAGRSKKLYLSQPQELAHYAHIIEDDYGKMVTLIKSFAHLGINANDKNITTAILNSQIEYGLDIADAFHIGTLFSSGEKDIVSFDIDHFDKVSGINLWCNY